MSRSPRASRSVGRAGARPAPRPPARGLLFAIVLCAALVFAVAHTAACSSNPGSRAAGSLRVTASTSFLADIAQNVAGARFTVATLIPRGSDPHSYEPTPSQIGSVVSGDIFIVNGGGLETTLLTTVRNAGGRVRIVDAAAGLPSRRPRPGEPTLGTAAGPDPHFWLNPIDVVSYVRRIRDAFAAADPKGTAAYSANAEAYIAQLRALDGWIAARVATIPPGDRTLVMDHLSHGYFADRYGFRIVGAVIPSTSTTDSATASQLARLVAAIRAAHVKAIFVEHGENPGLADQVASEAHVRVVTNLLDHTLTPAGGPAPTYIAMMRYDTGLIVEALR